MAALALLLTALPVPSLLAEPADGTNEAAAGSAAESERGAEFTISGSTLIKYNGKQADVSIPAHVTKIGPEAFKGCTFLENVTIPDGVTKIGNNAFEDCKSLALVSLPADLKSIGASAFSGCTSLGSVYVGAQAEIGPGAFAGCSSLQDVSLAGGSPYTCEDGVIYTDGGKTLVQYLSGRPSTSFSMPDTVEEIERYAFWGADLLVDITLSENISEISGYAFSNCKALNKVVIPDKVEELDLYSFQDCSALRSVYIPSGVSYIHATVFDGCPQLTVYADEGTYGASLAETAGLKVSHDTAQASVQEKTSNSANAAPRQTPSGGAQNPVTVYGYPPDTTVGQVLGEATIHDGGIEIALSGGQVITGGEVMDSEVSHDRAQAAEQAVLERWEPKDEYEVLQGVLDSYNGEEAQVRLDREVTVVGDRAFYRNKAVENVTLPGSVTEIDDFAFARSSLKSIEIPASVSRIGYAAFYRADDLGVVRIPDTVQEIELGAFEGSKWLENWKAAPSASDFLIEGDGILIAYKGNAAQVDIPDGVKTVGAEVFANHGNLTKVTFPDSVRRIGEGAFAGCSSLTSAALPEGVTEIEDRAFEGCPLSQVILPASVQRVGLGSFAVSENAGVKAVVFCGSELPEVVCKESAESLANQSIWKPAFDGISAAVVSAGTDLESGNVFSQDSYGFKGKVYEIGGSIYDYAASALKLSEQPVVLQVSAGSRPEGGIETIISSPAFLDAQAQAAMAGSKEAYQLHVADADAAAQMALHAALVDRYGSMKGITAVPVDMGLYDFSGSIQVRELGSTPVTVSLPLPGPLKGAADVHVACLDANGQFEELAAKAAQVNGASGVTFTAPHFSPYVIYTVAEADSTGGDNVTIGTLSGANAPGDRDASLGYLEQSSFRRLLKPNYLLAVPLFVGAAWLFFQKSGKKR